MYTLLGEPEKPDHATIHAVIKEAVGIERDFVTSALPVRLIGMNAELMGQYIEFVADRLLLSLGCSKLYGTANPLDFMEQLSLQGKSNFFEKRVGDYQKAGVAVAESKMPREIAFDADF